MCVCVCVWCVHVYSFWNLVYAGLHASALGSLWVCHEYCFSESVCVCVCVCVSTSAGSHDEVFCATVDSY